ncbi:MAG TPA: hypothetical protein VHE35_26365, partial [Kofleriaceae bacterium]|nr:hypothetical protein [Kofleriaceae bacterium]
MVIVVVAAVVAVVAVDQAQHVAGRAGGDGGDVIIGRRRQRHQAHAAGAVGDEHAAGDQGVEVHVQLEGRAEPLHRRHGPGRRAHDADGPRPRALPAEDSAHDAAEGARQELQSRASRGRRR